MFRGDCGCKKASSANVESIFSSAGALLADYHAGNLGGHILARYMRIKHNWQYECLRPSHDAIKKAYIAKFGKQAAVVVDSDSDDDN